MWRCGSSPPGAAGSWLWIMLRRADLPPRWGLRPRRRWELISLPGALVEAWRLDLPGRHRPESGRQHHPDCQRQAGHRADRRRGVHASPGPQRVHGLADLGAAGGLTVSHYDIALKPGTSTQAYINALLRTLGPGYEAYAPSGPSVAAQINTPYFRLLALLVAVLAGLGVLNSVLMATRERVHDLGVFKAVGMTPRQTLIMVICWVVTPTIIAALIALPAGLTLQDVLVRHLAATATGITALVLPSSFVHVPGIAAGRTIMRTTKSCSLVTRSACVYAGHGLGRRHDEPGSATGRAYEMGPGERLSGQGAPGNDPLVWLAGRCCDVLEVRVVVEDHRAVVFCHRGGQQVDHSGGPMTTARHPDLNIAGAVSDHLADRQDHVEFFAALRDRAHVSEITTGVARFQVNSHAGGGGTVGDEPRDDIADDNMLASGVC